MLCLVKYCYLSFLAENVEQAEAVVCFYYPKKKKEKGAMQFSNNFGVGAIYSEFVLIVVYTVRYWIRLWFQTLRIVSQDLQVVT